MRLAILLAHGYTSGEEHGREPDYVCKPEAAEIDRRYPGAETFRYAVAMRT
jgi:hypothetical protein